MNGVNPLSPDEYVLRRISACELKVADETFPWMHFSPRRDDIDGLSLMRATVKTPEQMVEGQRNKCGYYVAKFQVQELIALGLTLVPTEHIALGHVSIPELSYPAFTKNKTLTQAKMRTIAKLAWQRKVFGPTLPLI